MRERNHTCPSLTMLIVSLAFRPAISASITEMSATGVDLGYVPVHNKKLITSVGKYLWSVANSDVSFREFGNADMFYVW